MKIALGMSGGVDSSLSAALLKDAGHEVTGVYLECWRAPGCRAEEDRKDALAVALSLNIPFRVLDFKEAYRQRVVEEFFRAYERGLTPNPDIWCNTEIKFGLFYEWAMKQGFDAVATGHYAQIMTNGTKLTLCRSVDTKKDQTYFLYRTRQEQLAHIVFPIGHLAKDAVRSQAKQRGLLVADKPDSQGICFIGDIDVRAFLRDRFGEKEGDVLDVDGSVIGKHQGHWLYTIGQRHGFELFPQVYTKHQQWKHVLPPLYVIAKNAQNNTLTVGFGVETLQTKIKLGDVFWRDQQDEPQSNKPKKLLVRLRHGGQLLSVQLTNNRLILVEGQRGVAPGQSVVFYDNDNSMICLGGGVIE